MCITIYRSSQDYINASLDFLYSLIVFSSQAIILFTTSSIASHCYPNSVSVIQVIHPKTKLYII